MTNKDQILSISKKLGLSHIGSCLSVLPILEEIYQKRVLGDMVILDNAHAHLAHLLTMNAYQIDRLFPETDTEEINIVERIEKYGIHCDQKAGCDSSDGSLGHGIGIGIGYAIANPDKTIWTIVSDGSMMEGSNWEALRLIHDLKIKNIIIYCNFNGYTAVEEIDRDYLCNRMQVFLPGKQIYYRRTSNTKEFDGVQGHYRVL